ncbi:MAG: MerR family transcriptional regulator [Egibacteraceae bacterium]
MPPTARGPAGHRLYDAQALARLELVATLRGLGLGLDTVRAVLERRTTVAQVAAAHVQALEAQIRALRLRQAVLSVAAARGSTVEEMKLVNELAQLSITERQRLVDEFIAETFGDIPDESGIGTRMRQFTPALPDDPTPEQVDAWVEVAELVGNPSFRARVREMAEAGARQHPFDREAAQAFAATVSAHAGPAVAAGIDPASPEAEEILGRILPEAGTAKRAELAQLLATFTDTRVDRYWRLVGIINGWPSPVLDPALPVADRSDITWLKLRVRDSRSPIAAERNRHVMRAQVLTERGVSAEFWNPEPQSTHPAYHAAERGDTLFVPRP